MIDRLNNFDFGEESTPNPRRTELQEKQRVGAITPEEKAELQGIYAFPNNPRGADLQKKEALGEITDEEKIELQASRGMYADNPRGKELIIKEQLGTLTFKEKTEIQDLYLQNRYSEEFLKLKRCVENGDTDIKRVGMNDGKSIEVLATDDKEQTIFTDGLLGCIATLVFAEDEKGDRRAVLTHYDPKLISNNILKLEQLIDANSAMKISNCKQTVFILSADNTEKYEKEVEALKLAIQANLGEDIEIKTEPYSVRKAPNVKDWGVLVVKIPPKSQATYNTWFSQGQLGKSDEEKITEIKKSLST